MSYVFLMSGRNDSDPHSAVAVMSDEVEVVNLNPDAQSLSDEMQEVFDFRTEVFLREHAGKMEPNAENLMDFILINNSQPIGSVEEYDTDEKALEAVHMLSSTAPSNVSSPAAEETSS